MTLFIISIVVALGVSFLCSLMEAALLSITPSKIAVLAEKHPAASRVCRVFKDDIEKPIAVILILNTSAHTFGAAIAGAQFDKLFGSNYIWLFSLIFTVVMVQFTEILPKTLGVCFNSMILKVGAPVLKFLIWLLNPLVLLVHWVNKPFAMNSGEDAFEANTLNEIEALAVMARQCNHISTTQEQILRNVPSLGERTIEDLMQPLDKVCVIPEHYSSKEIIKMITGKLHSRYPVCKSNNRNEIMGFLSVKDLLLYDDDWRKSLKPVMFIDMDIPQLNLIEDILAFDSKLLIVRNKKGQAVGMLTVNDVVMELLGKEFPVFDNRMSA